jgi:glycosyltransferase involved in cell wall biosynthesis
VAPSHRHGQVSEALRDKDGYKHVTDKKNRILAIIPSYNEEESLPITLAELKQVRPDVDAVVVDDGSVDRTAEVAKSMGVPVISLPVNLGIGGAVQSGLHYALRNGYDAALQYDADGQHRPDQIGWLVDPILAGEADMVLGSRFLKGTGYKVELHRAAMMWLLRTLTSMAIGQKITDNTSGFRAYGKDAIRFMTMNCSCDYPEIEAIIRLARSGYKFKEVSTSMRERVAGQSMFTPFRAAYFIIRSLMAVMISAWSTPKCVGAKTCGGGGKR